MSTKPDSDFLETHFEIVKRIVLEEEVIGKSNVVFETLEQKGTGGLYGLAEDLTIEFQEQHKDQKWDGEFLEVMEDFLDEKLYTK